MNIKLFNYRAIVSGLCLAALLIFGQAGFVLFTFMLGEMIFYPKTKKKLDERETALTLQSIKLSFILFTLFLVVILELIYFEVAKYSILELIYLTTASMYFFTSVSFIYMFKKNSAL